jgi:hypothetical protein
MQDGRLLGTASFKRSSRPVKFVNIYDNPIEQGKFKISAMLKQALPVNADIFSLA